MNERDPLRVAWKHYEAGRLPQAEQFCSQVLRRDPAQARALHLLGLIMHRRGNPHGALDLLLRAQALAPDDPEIRNDLGISFATSGRLAEAEEQYRHALKLKPGFAQALSNLGELMVRRGDLASAVEYYREAVAARPELAVAHYNLGSVSFALGDTVTAESALTRALELAPDYVEAWSNLGLLRNRQRRYEEALRCYLRALELRPDFVQAHLNLSGLYVALGRFDEAMASGQRALALRPDSALACYNMGLACYHRGNADEAVEWCGRALALEPGNVEALVCLAQAMSRQGRVGETVSTLREALRLRPDHLTARSALSYALLCVPAPAEEMWEEHRRCGELIEARNPPVRARAASSAAGRRLRIGYVSPDLRDHSVARFFEPVLAGHDRTEFEIWCYYDHSKEDAVTARLRSLAEHWVPCVQLSDDELTERVVNDGIDILIDLAGHTSGNRLGVFARRPAPVQVTWLGYPATTGLESMDWRLCSEETDPEGSERWHSERLYRLRSLWCFRPRGDEEPPRMQETPSLQRGGEVWFGSMNNLAKVSAETVRTWSRILREVPNSRLVMTNVPEGEARRRVAERFGREGIGEERLLLHGRLPDGEYRAVLDGVDLALDPFPYNGTTTSCETLWRGIPLVTLKGDRSVSRSGYALLKAVGLEELVSADEEGYVRLAVELARDPERLSRLRRELPERFAGSVLRDEKGFVRDLEAAYRSMWQEAISRHSDRHAQN
jgi:protein O-GlcNAc transferase